MSMRKTWLLAVLGVGLGACLGPQQSNNDPDDRASAAISATAKNPSQALCTPDKLGFHCVARKVVHTDSFTPDATGPSGNGLAPADIISAYDIDTTLGSGITVGLVELGGDNSVAADLAAYRTAFSLPACTVANGCLKIVSATGTSTLPANDSGWAGETALDVDTISAACPLCKIVVVQADLSKATTNAEATTVIGQAEKTAVSLGATVVSNSWSFNGEDKTLSDTPFTAITGVGLFFSAGDSGYLATWPATVPSVHAVGGTLLTKTTTVARGWVETVWGSSEGANDPNGGTGSGCSAFEPKPSYQKDTSACKFRTMNDLAADADPNSGLAIYDSQDGGWEQVGGTSLASPLVATIFAMTGHGAETPAYEYTNASIFNDVTSGTDGSCGTGATAELCTAKAGYDGPTGNGTPNAKSMKAGGSVCTPVCTGKTCGDNGCGGSCGTCASGDTCSSSGTCVATTCTPVCTGKTCGSDGCGGTCGTCSGSDTCSTAGKCVAPVTSTCSHDQCTTGTKLKSGCDTCVTAICAEDSYCCKTKWDSVCTSEVSSICGDTCS